MDIKQKIRRWLKETGTVQNHLATIAKIESGNMSRIVNGKQAPKAVDVFHLSRVMGVSMDWLCDPATKWPPVYLNTEAKQLTQTEQTILELAYFVSESDEDPGELATARKRLLLTKAVEAEPTDIHPKRIFDVSPKTKGRTESSA